MMRCYVTGNPGSLLKLPKALSLDIGSLVKPLAVAAGYPDEFGGVLEMLTSGFMDLEPMIRHRFNGADVMAAFESATRQEQSAKVLVQYVC